MSAKLTISLSSSFGKNISPVFPNTQADKQISPDSLGETKNLFTSEGQLKGCCFDPFYKTRQETAIGKATVETSGDIFILSE
jgi:hypothetical protein